ncbi:MAG: cytochrome C oxidase subunit IV family protein [Bacteriovoracales bacterium]|nr:cytochrome C oxidase subunit IV family protein [Bacteriovoracales bacterium]
MAEYVSHKKEYILIFVALALLTVLELFVPEMEATKVTKGTILTLLAVVKAGMVAWYFMHLKEERGWLKFIALIPISAFLYAVVLILEILYR